MTKIKSDVAAPKQAAAKKATVKAAAKKTLVKTPVKKAAVKAKTAVKPKLIDPIAAQLKIILKVLDDGKAEDVLDFDITGRSSLADYIVVASGKSNRQVGAMAENVRKTLKDNGHAILRMEGTPENDWVLVDTGDIIVHLFRPEVREFYRLEDIWKKSPTNPDA